jgi:acetylornithine deacetylase/succinyl-diaminopimelate desuccinylase-like protein
MSASIQTFIDANRDRFVAELFEFLRFPSISTLAERSESVAHCAEHLREELACQGFEARVLSTGGHPIVYGEDLRAGAAVPTVLFYGHYDVQPADPLDLWTTPPFEPQVRNGRVYARGAADDKGQVHLHIKGFEALRAAHGGALPCNVKILIEGEEEVGSPNLASFLERHLDMLACDTVLICDTSMFAEGMPTITYALRGLAYFEIHVRGPNTDLHSGMFGGVVDNPVQVLATMLAGMKDQYGRVTIPGFYDNVLPVSPDERTRIRKLPFDEEQFCDGIGIPMTRGEFGYSPLEQNWCRPTLEINGIWGGFTGEGAKTVVPAGAHAKISMRIVPNQTPEEIDELFRKHILAVAPPTVNVEVVTHHGGPPALTPVDSKGSLAAQEALRRAFGKEPVFIRDGASIPIVSIFQSLLGSPVVLMGFSLPDANCHAPDENFPLASYFGGIAASAYFYEEMGK